MGPDPHRCHRKQRKTTTKEMIAAFLEGFLTISKSEGNLNNEYGLPLSLLRIRDDADAAVVEIGINHPGELRPLADMAAPNIGVVTNVGAAHVGNFDSVEAIAAEKRRLIESLRADGIAVLNADDPRVAAFRTVHPGVVSHLGSTRRPTSARTIFMISAPKEPDSV